MSTEHFDLVVIGSGAGGSPIATELARVGKRVLVLEKGPLLRSQDELQDGNLSDFKRDEMFNVGTEKRIQIPGVSNTGSSYFSSLVEPDLNDEPHIYSAPNSSEQRVTIEGYTAQVVGGGTQLYGAVSLRFTPEDFQLKTFNQDRQEPLGDDPGDTLDGVTDWPIQYNDLLPYYEKAEKLVGINGSVAGQAKPFDQTDTYQSPPSPNPISEYARRGMDALGFDVYRTPLAVITEDHAPSGRSVPSGIETPKTGYVNRYGDPMAYKSNTWVSLLRPAIEDEGLDIEIRPNCNVTHLQCDGSKISRVHYRDASGAEKSVSGEQVVVACSAIESVRLLMISSEEDPTEFGARMKYGTSDGLLGSFFLTHCFGGSEVTVLEPKGDGSWTHFDKSISLDSDYATDALASPDWLRANRIWAGGAIYNNTSDQALPVSLARNHGSADLDTNWLGFTGDPDIRGDRLTEWMDRDFGTRLSVSFMANQVPVRENRIQLSNIRDKWGRPVAHVIKDWHPHDRFLMNGFADVCREILLRGVPDATRDSIAAYEGLSHGQKESDRFKYATIESGSVYGNGVRIANHILGGMRFGLSPDTSVLDPNCRVWNFDNLYVTDGSFMPTSGSGNPTLTIQANAFRVADFLKTL